MSKSKSKQKRQATLENYFSGIQITDPPQQPPLEPTSQKKPRKKPVKAQEQLFIPSTEQQAIIDAIKSGNNVAVNAVAGSGKTTTILGLAAQCPERSILQPGIEIRSG
jgi:HrpA-like RNA helicase